MLLVCRAEYGDPRAQSRDLVFKLFVITSIIQFKSNTPQDAVPQLHREALEFPVRHGKAF
jgi:hypothetical protein